MKTYIAIDLGGTNVRVAKMDESGNLLHVLKTSSYAKEGKDRIISNIKELITQTPGYEECSGIGIGIPGACDQEKGCILIDTNVPGLKNYPFVEDFERTFHMPVRIENDADLAGLGEAIYGIGKGYPSVFYITISTGIGGAFILNQKIVTGRKGFGGEIANLVIDPNRKKINYLARGAVENEASGTAVIRKANEAFNAPVAHAGEVFQLAREGNEKAQEIVHGAIQDLARMLANISAVIAPHIFILGGGFMKSSDYFMDDLIHSYKELVHEELKDTPIVQAGLDEPGLMGAIELVKNA
ncbi:MAG: ROK family protein [Solobacterium sp.]|nr:ROK family protein [Solobacterium sp.]